MREQNRQLWASSYQLLELFFFFHFLHQLLILDSDLCLSFLMGSRNPSDKVWSGTIWQTHPCFCTVITMQHFESSVQLSSISQCVWFFVTPWTTARQAYLSITYSRSLLKLMSIESVMPSNHLILCHPLLPSPSILPSSRVFSNESALCIRWPKYWSFSFSISPFNEYSGLIPFRIDCFGLFAVQGTLESSPTPQFKSINSPTESKRLFYKSVSLFLFCI